MALVPDRNAPHRGEECRMLPFIASFFLATTITPAHTVAVPVTDDGDEVEDLPRDASAS